MARLFEGLDSPLVVVPSSKRLSLQVEVLRPLYSYPLQGQLGTLDL
jgi:hypothetical protein